MKPSPVVGFLMALKVALTAVFPLMTTVNLPFFRVMSLPFTVTLLTS